MENAISLSTSKSLPFKILNNFDWYKETTMLDFLTSSKRYRVGDMLRIGPVKNRMDKEVPNLKIGGSDQLGNFKTGFEHLSLEICVPLITDGNGNKLGKSSKGNTNDGFWLSAEKTSPFAFYQYFRQLHDDVSAKFLSQFSLKEAEDVLLIIDEHNKNLGKWIAQTHLADEMTSLVHGQEGLQLAKRCSQLLFHGSLDDLENLERAKIQNTDKKLDVEHFIFLKNNNYMPFNTNFCQIRNYRTGKLKNEINVNYSLKELLESLEKRFSVHLSSSLKNFKTVMDTNMKSLEGEFRVWMGAISLMLSLIIIPLYTMLLKSFFDSKPASSSINVEHVEKALQVLEQGITNINKHLMANGKEKQKDENDEENTEEE